MVNPDTKCVISMFTHCEDMEGKTNLEFWGGLEGQGSPKVTSNVTIH